MKPPMSEFMRTVTLIKKQNKLQEEIEKERAEEKKDIKKQRRDARNPKDLVDEIAQ